VETLAQFDTVLELLTKLGVQIRREHLGGEAGGLCRIRGQAVVFIDLDADVATQLSRCIDALAGMPEVDTMYLPPTLREQIEICRAEG